MRFLQLKRYRKYSAIIELNLTHLSFRRLGHKILKFHRCQWRWRCRRRRRRMRRRFWLTLSRRAAFDCRQKCNLQLQIERWTQQAINGKINDKQNRHRNDLVRLMSEHFKRSSQRITNEIYMHISCNVVNMSVCATHSSACDNCEQRNMNEAHIAHKKLSTENVPFSLLSCAFVVHPLTTLFHCHRLSHLRRKYLFIKNSSLRWRCFSFA